LTARGGEPIITAFELRPLVEASMAQARPLLADKPVELVADLARDLPTLSTDQDRLRQVLLHLLSNAAKFTHRGEIRVSARIEEAEPSNVLVLAVSDTGVGMPADALPHIFEEFRQVDGSSTRSHGGAGLGLALVMHQCRLLHGEVAVESQPEEGSTFTVRLPVDLAACQERRAELRQEVERGEPDPADRSTPIALVVTDEPQLVLDLRRWLEPRGYRVAAVFDRDQALSRAWAILPCAVVLDVMVPGSEVWELADVLGADPRTTDIPLVVISSLGGREIAEAVGASDWLPRPPAPEALLNALERLRTTGAAAILAIVGDAQRRDWARRSLREAGYQVTTCAACSDACHFAGSHFDLILLDPEAEGEGVLTALGSVRTGFLADTPVVAWVPPDYPDPERERLASDVCALVEQQLDDPADLLDAVAAALADT
ncbi:MAG: ATP-binding protein, partial [Planctomycetota bacterium]